MTRNQKFGCVLAWVVLLVGAVFPARALALDFSGGFAGSGSVLNFNGSAQIASGTRARLTSGGANQAGALWGKNLVDFRNFTSQFSFKLTAGSGFGEGFTFTFQRAGNTALGLSGSCLGYCGILSSVALKFDLLKFVPSTGVTTDVSTTGLYVGGDYTSDSPPGTIDMASAGIDLHSGHVFSVSLSYNSATCILHQVVTDMTDTNHPFFAYDHAIDLVALLGGTRAYVGLTGGTGTQTSTQDILTWTYSSGPDPYNVTFSAYPQCLELYPRNRVTNTAGVQVAGTETAGGFASAVLRVYRDGVQAGADQVHALGYSGGTAAFSFTATIAAELAEYDIELVLRNGAGQEFVVRRATNVVAGDVFIIQGQSNATTIRISGNANAYASPYIRTFGVACEDPWSTVGSRSWYVANDEGGTNNGVEIWVPPGGIGQWGMVLGNRLMTENGVPIAIMQGGRGGSPISYFQRNDTNPADLATNYGRLLFRMQQSGLVGAVRSILYYQGDSDLGDWNAHKAGYEALHADWPVDYPGIERFYVFQSREGCGVTRFDVDLRNVQRLFGDEFNDVGVVSTNGFDSHDGCHYAFTDGYEEIGLEIARMVQRDLYGGPSLANTDPPNPASAAVLVGANHDRIRIPLRNKTDTVTFDAGAEVDFAVDGTDVHVLSGTVSNGAIELQLSGSAAGASAVRYTGHSFAGPWVANANGIGLLSFIVPIVTDTTAPVITLVGANPLAVSVGGTFADPGATALDNVDGNLTAQIMVSGGPVVTSAPGSFTLIYHVSDAAGNAAVPVMRTVNVVDTTAPVITLVGANPLAVSVGEEFAEPGASAVDNVDGNLTAQITVSGGPVVTSAPGSFTLTYHVSDAAGNAAVPVMRTVNVVDTTAPVITLVGANPLAVSVGGTFADPGATALDNVDGNLTAQITVSGGPVVTSAPGSFTLTYHVSDAAGNAAVPVMRTVNVVDTTAPVITLVGANPLAVSVGGTFADPGASAMDNVDGNLTAQIMVSGGPVVTSAPGSFTLTYHVSDAAGNVAVPVMRTVNVVDTTAPVITLVGANPLVVSVGGEFADPGATALDNVDGNLTVQIMVSGGPVVTSAPGSFTLTYHVSDAAGNAAVPVMRTVNVVDTTAPVITLVGANPLVVSVGGEFEDPGATALDNVDGNLTAQITVSGGPVVTSAPGSFTLTYHVSDAAGNAAVPVTRTVNVANGADMTVPVITLLGANPLVVSVGGEFEDPGATALDNVDGNLTAQIMVSGGPVVTSAPGSFTLTYHVSDAAGNAAVPVTRTVLVVELVTPILQIARGYNSTYGTYDAHVTFDTVLGLEYCLFTSTDLTNWTPLTTFFDGNGLSVELAHDGGGSNPPRFYVVKVRLSGQ